MLEGYVHINSIIFPTLIAVSEREQQQGLMNVEYPPPVMSFIYASPRINKFWMHRTPSPLDIIFCCNGEVSQICAGEPYSTAPIGFDKESDLVIELPYGVVSASDIKVGNKVGIVKPTKLELNKIIAQRY